MWTLCNALPNVVVGLLPTLRKRGMLLIPCNSSRDNLRKRKSEEEKNGHIVVVVFLSYSVCLTLSVVSHSFFWTIKTTSLGSWSESELASELATASQCNAVRYFFTKSITCCLSLMIMKPVGLSIRSISSNRSSWLQSLVCMSERTVHAWSKS